MRCKESASSGLLTRSAQRFSHSGRSNFTDFFFIDDCATSLTFILPASSAFELAFISFFLESHFLVVITILLDLLQLGLFNSDGFFTISASVSGCGGCCGCVSGCLIGCCFSCGIITTCSPIVFIGIRHNLKLSLLNREFQRSYANEQLATVWGCKPPASSWKTK